MATFKKSDVIVGAVRQSNLLYKLKGVLMPREHTCALGNCPNTFYAGEGVTVTMAGETKRYCCDLHAAWAIKLHNQETNHYGPEGIRKLRDLAQGPSKFLDAKDIW